MEREQLRSGLSLAAAGQQVDIHSLHRSDLAALETLGQGIRSHRLRRRQAHNRRPWAQEDLAVAIGSDKAHINRIECGRQLSTYDTVVRICDALELGWEERSHLLSLAGYLLSPPSPTPQEVEAVTRRARCILDAADYPMYLADHEQRIWDVNDLFASAFIGYPGRDACLGETRGLMSVELLSLGHPVGAWLRQVLVDYESYARRQLALFRTAFRYRPHSAEYRVILQDLLSDRRLEALWLWLCSNEWGHGNPDFLDHQVVRVDHPQIGGYAVRILQSPMIADDRFILIHHLPGTDRARRLFHAIAEGFRRWPARVYTSASSAVAPGTQKPLPVGPRRASGAYPSRPITLIVPWSAGGCTDVGARILAGIAEKELGQHIVVVNKVGEGSLAGLVELAKQNPDGYHLGFINLPALNTGSLAADRSTGLGVDSFTFIINQVYDPTGVFVRADSPYGSFGALIDDARRRPGELTVGTSGVLTPAHLAALLLEKEARIRFRFVHYSGSAEHINRFFGGGTDVAFFCSGPILPKVRAGDVRVLAMYANERFGLLPHVPTTAESGYPALVLASTRGIGAPRGVPESIVRQVEAVFRVAMESPEHIRKMEKAGFGLKMMAGDEYSELAYRQGRLYRDLIPRLAQGS